MDELEAARCVRARLGANALRALEIGRSWADQAARRYGTRGHSIARRALWMTGLLLAFGSPARVRAEVVALAALERVALEHRPALEAGMAHARGSAAEVDKARSAYYPRLSVEAAGMLAPGGAFARVRDTDGNDFLVSAPRRADADGLFGGSAAEPQLRSELGLELKGNVYDFGRTAAAVAASRALAAAADAEIDSVRFAIVRGVRGAYLSWLGSSELFGIAQRAQQDAQARRARVEARIAEGVRPRSDLPAARAEELLTQLELERSRGELSVARLAVEQATGAPLSASAEPDRALLESAPADAAERPPAKNPVAAVLELQGAAAAATAHALSKADAPVLSGGFSAGVRSQASLVFPAYSFGLQFTLPLWDGGASSASARVGSAQAEEVAARVRQQREQDRAAAERRRVDAENASTRLQTAEQLLEIASQRVADAEQGYELGAGDLDALANARALLRRAQSEAILARIARAQARLL